MLSKDVPYGGRFYTGQDGQVYTRLRPGGNVSMVEKCMADDWVYTINSDLRLVAFNGTEFVTVID